MHSSSIFKNYQQLNVDMIHFISALSILTQNFSHWIILKKIQNTK